jgi:hypothetical protein
VNNVIQSYKESTPQGQASGVGRVMASEINLWQDAYAAVEASQSADVRAKNLQRLMAVTQRLRQTSRQYFGNVYGVKVSGNAPTGGPAVGAIQKGYRFKGGNPSDPNSWEKVK